MNHFKFNSKKQQTNKSPTFLMRKETRNRFILPIFVLLTCLVISYLYWSIANTSANNEFQSYFEYRVRDVNARIEQRVISYEQILKSVHGFYKASQNVSRAEFRLFINSLRLDENYPGIQGVGFSLIIPSEQRKDHITGIRKEGFPEYKIWPEGNRETYTSIIYLEPYKDLNLRAFGYDMFSEPVRRKAMEIARDSNETIISGKVSLVQETGNAVQAGFLIYLPIYRNGTPHTTIIERRTNILGWVYSPFRMGDFMAGLFGEHASDLDVKIYDSKDISNETKLYDSNTQTTMLDQPLAITKEIDFNGHKWTVIVKSTPKLEERIGFNQARIILIVGLCLSLLLSILTWLLVNKRMQTIIANTERRRSEESLQESEERFRSLYENSTIGLYRTTPGGKILIANPTLVKMLGYSSFEEIATRDLEKDGFEYKFERKQFIEQTEMKGEVNGFESAWTRKDGTIVYVLESARAIRDSIGKTLYYDGTVEDITETKVAKDLLLESEDKYRKLFANNPQSMFIYDLETLAFLEVNSAAINHYGYTKEEFLSMTLIDIRPGEDVDALMKDIDLTRRTHNPTGEWRHVKKNGEIIHVEIVSSSITFNARKARHVMVNDITERKQAEEKLRTSEEKHRKLIEQLQEGFIYVNNDDVIQFINPMFCKMLGYEKSELIGKTGYELLLNPADKELIIKKNQQRQKGITDDYELNMIKKSGEQITLQMMGSPLENENGEIIGSMAVCLDITQRKLAEDRQDFISNILSVLNRPNEWQQIINDILSEIKIFTGIEAIAIRLKEGEDYPYFITDGFPKHFVEMERFLCSRNLNDEIIYETEGKPLLECLCGNIISCRTNPSLPFFTKGGSFWSNNTTELLASTSEEDLGVNTRNRCTAEGYESVALIPLKSGMEMIGLLQFNDKRTDRFTIEIIQFFERIGSTIGIALKRMQAEKQIKESEERYRFIVEATNDIIYRLKYDSMKYDYINPALTSLTGYTPEEINEIGFRNIVVKTSKLQAGDVNLDLVTADRKQGITGEWQADYQIRIKDGRLIWLSDHSYPWLDETGNLIGSIGILSDITERKRAEDEIIKVKEKAEEMNRLKSSFLSNMSHELRTPLIGILGFAEILKDALTNEENKEQATIIFESATRLKETLNLILDISKIEAESLKIYLEEIELTSYIPILVNVFEKSAEIKGIELKVITGEELLFSKLDKALLNSIINNLINNAIKYTRKGKITLEIKKVIDRDRVYVEILIDDAGVGISEDDLSIIFHPFRQASEGYNRRFEGTGLGLTLVKKYVERMNGIISVKSKVGIGSTFKVRFPVIKSEFIISEKVDIEEKKENDVIETKIVGKPLILYVEDDILSQKVISSIVRNSYEIECVEDGEGAIELVKRKKYDVILMDINLRGELNGLETAQIIRKLKEYIETPILAVTAFAMVGDKEKILSQGCTHYISKPFSKAELLSLISKAFNSKNK